MAIYLQGENPNRACYNCGSLGHLRNSCPDPKNRCGYCKKEGHAVRDCLKAKPCQRCGQRAHKADRCQNSPVARLNPAAVQPDPSQSSHPSEMTPVRFPTLRHMIILLATALQGDFGRESYLRHIPYTDVVSLFDSIDSFTEVLLGTVDPTIRNLEGRIITRSLLDEVRQAQAKHETQWPLNSGYLDYVSDDRDPDYWRPYVGQSSNTEQRIAQHVRAIRTGDTDTLHYFVIRRGDGHRTANFIRLWTLALPENVDPVINNALNNILEMIMAPIRAEIKPHGQKHPQRWAYHVTSDDPASRLAFRLTVMGPENQEFGFYASGRGTKLVKKANGFIDWMSGVTDEEIATRPRRYLNIQMSHEKVHEALRPFVGGAYTDDNGNIMSVEDKR